MTNELGLRILGVQLGKYNRIWVFCADETSLTGDARVFHAGNYAKRKLVFEKLKELAILPPNREPQLSLRAIPSLSHSYLYYASS